jgi:hypothetical protein
MRKKFLCLDCKVDTGKIGEHYFVHTPLWMKAVGSNKGMLCVGCLEKRVGRELNKEDFPPVHINNPKLYSMSYRLRSRIFGV